MVYPRDSWLYPPALWVGGSNVVDSLDKPMRSAAERRRSHWFLQRAAGLLLRNTAAQKPEGSIPLWRLLSL
jgi:hypothetical protein